MLGALPGAGSVAPMEHLGPGLGRGAPRWSKAPGPQTATPFNVVGRGIAPTAGLPEAGTWSRLGRRWGPAGRGRGRR